MTFYEKVAEVNSAVNNVVWGIPMIILIIAVGLWLTIGNRGVQFRHFGYAIKNTLGLIFKQKKTVDKGAITPFQALSTALSATVGTGNIAGVAGAIALGGPGAVFWMWVSSLIGMCTKYTEIVLAIRYRQRNKDGEWVGGPMYYIQNGLGKNMKWLSIIFCILAGLASFGIGNIAQVNSIATCISDLINAFSPNPEAVNYQLVNLIVGIVLTIIVGVVLFGGVKRIGSATAKIVPFMGIFYIIGSLIVIFANIDSIGTAFSDIFANAFGAKAVLGGTAGFAIKQAMQRGFSRGIFSNEAGLGSAPIAHAAADTPGPVYQGIYGILEVFIDTIVICTLTALVILTSGVEIEYGVKIGASLTTAGLSTVFGAKFSTIFMAVSLGCFAFSTILGWSLYGTRTLEYLFGPKAKRPYQILFLIVVILGSVMDLGLAWDISDTLNALMAIPNLIALIALSGVAFKITKEHFNKVKIEK